MSIQISPIELQQNSLDNSQNLNSDYSLCLCILAGNIKWAMDTNDIIHVTQMPKKEVLIPQAPPHIRGLVQKNGEIYTIFDFGYIINGLLTDTKKSNRLLFINPILISGVAILVEKSYSPVSLHNFKTIGAGEHELSELTVVENSKEQYFQWLHFERLKYSPFLI